MENTLENKVKFFAQYYWQELRIYPENVSALEWKIDLGTLASVDNLVLKLKTLSSITDEDAIEVAKSICAYFNYNENVVSKDENNNVNVLNGNYMLKIGKKIDELNRGFVLIINGIGVQSMFAYDAIMFYKKLIELGYYVGDGNEIEYGWVKLEES